MRLAISLEYYSNRPTFAAFDFLVEIEEGPPEFRGQAPADRSFSGAHESNQVDNLCHPEILAYVRMIYWKLEIEGWKLKIGASPQICHVGAGF